MNLQTKENYAEAKKLLKELTWKRDNMRGSDSFTQHMKMHVSLLEAVLLAYRRQHNIFEVGDCVVKTNPKIKHAHVRVVISTSPSGGAVLDYQGFPYKFPRVRHATNEEIQAGRRL